MSGEIISHDQKFLHLTIPTVKLERLCTGMLWTEGPVYFPLGDYLLWSDIPNNRIMQWMDGVGSRIYREDSNNSNGNTRDHQGRLITCEHRSRCVTRTEHDGSITVLADSYDGKRLNSPNDVVMKSDGTIWFTDPPYGILSDFEGKKSPQEQKACNVFRLDLESGSLDVAIDDFDKPNGLAFSPDESILYVSDTGISHTENGPRHIRALDVADGKSLSNSRVFAEIENGAPDGFRLDVEGNVWTSTGGGVQCFSPEGRLLGEIVIDEMVANVTFGGPKNNRLFITATTSLYSIFLGTNGLV